MFPDVIDSPEGRAHRLSNAMILVLDELGFDPKNPSTKDTPQRFAQYLLEFCNPINIERVLGDGFDAPELSHSEMVTQHNIPFRMVCEHHLLPALGHAAIGYVPGDRVIGLSKLTRLVDAVGRERPSLQEYINDRIADLLVKHIKPKGVIVVISAEHTCMAARGINAPGVITSSSSLRGIFRDVPAARQEFFSIIGR